MQEEVDILNHEEDSSDQYFWKKNSGPDIEKDFVHNRCVDYSTSFLKSYGLLVKTYHVSDQPGTWGRKKHSHMDDTLLSKDLVPFVSYTINKSKRWELVNNFGADMIKSLQEFQNDIDIVLLRRHFITLTMGISVYHTSSWFYLSKINTCHYLKNENNCERPTYHTKKVRGQGQPYSSFAPETSKKTNVTIAYNFLEAPKNYKKIIQKQYCDSNYGRHWPACGYWKRLDRFKLLLQEVRYADLDNFEMETENDVESSESCKESENNHTLSSFYDLEEHFIEKFVNVKRVKTKMR